MNRFGLAIMNPPYDGSLHLKILEKVIPVADEVVNISPGNQMFAAKRFFTEHSIVAKSKVLKEHIKDVKLIMPEDARNIFAVSFAGPLMLIHYDNSIKGKDYREFNIAKDCKHIIDKTIMLCVNKEIKNLQDAIDENSNKKYILPCPEVHGNQGSKDWAEITSSNYEKALNSKQRFGWHLAFDTEKERRNCYDSWHTTFHKAIHTLVKSDNFNNYCWLPYMQDYSKPWTNERFCKYFDITGFISDTEAEENSEWEEILTTMEKYK